MSADGRLIIREEEDANTKMEEEEGAKGGAACRRRRAKAACICLRIHSPSGHSVSDHMHLLTHPFTIWSFSQ